MSTFIENYQRVLQDQGKMSGSQWVFHCPFEGCVGYEKRKFFVDPVKGFWCCKHCSKEVPEKTYRENCKDASGGTWKEFCELMDDDPSLWPTGSVAADTSTKARPLTSKKRREVWSRMFASGELSEADAALIRERGIDPVKAGMISATPELLAQMQALYDNDTLVRAGIIYLSRDNVFARSCMTPGRILIPYYDGDEVLYFVGYMKCPKRRPDQAMEDYQVIRADWKKIASPAGYSPTIFGDVPEGAEYVVITEGQLKAEAARQQGLICVGLQGITNSHATLVKKLVAAKTKRAIICFDTQTEDQDNVDWAADKLARELLKAKIPTYRCKLPLDPEVDKGKKMDVDSFLLHYGLDAFVNALADAVPYELIEGDEDDAATDPDEGASADGDG
jgi:hypothetical protein